MLSVMMQTQGRKLCKTARKARGSSGRCSLVRVGTAAPFTGSLSWVVGVPPRLGVPSPRRHFACGRRQGTRPELESLVVVQNAERLLSPGEVALLFRVDPKTVTRWASAGRIGSIRTPGGHRRFRESEVRDLLTDLTVDLSPSTA